MFSSQIKSITDQHGLSCMVPLSNNQFHEAKKEGDTEIIYRQRKILDLVSVFSPL